MAATMSLRLPSKTHQRCLSLNAAMVLGFSRVVEYIVNIVAPCNTVASCVLLPSAADHLPYPFRALAQTPQLTLFLAIGGYLVFLVLFLPLYAISFVLTAAGAWAVLLGVVYAGGRGLTQTISYPGASKQIQREMELEYTKNVSSRLCAFVNSLRLWFQLVRDPTVVPSGMDQYRFLHGEVRERATKGDVWMLTRALEQLTIHAYAPLEDVPGGGGGRARGGSSSSSPAVLVASKGLGALAPSAVAEAECLLQSLTELAPVLNEAQALTEELAHCNSSYEFDRTRQMLLSPAISGREQVERFTATFDTLEARTTKLMRLAKQLRVRRKASAKASANGNKGSTESTRNGNKGSSTPPIASGTAAEEKRAAAAVADADADNVDSVRVSEGGDSPPKEASFPGSLLKSWWNSRSPYDGAAGFALMREEMLLRSNAQQIWLKMSDGVMLDCCFARSRGRHGSRDGVAGESSGNIGGGAEAEGSEQSSTGCVLFCNPNAGYYESTVLAGDGNRNWISFYTSVGCDVFLFNYRGYGRSGGRASPTAINRDVKEVAGFLREQLGVTRLAVHGESIGGIAAANVARHCQVDLLVLDRTFASLSGVAQRLMGGWTKWAIWGFTGWKADVAADYLFARCYKVLACDPEDVVISDAASTKSGLCVKMELGNKSSSLDVYEPPKAYKVADHTKRCPPVERVSLPLTPRERLSHLQIAHFAACLRYIARKAPRIQQSNSDVTGLHTKRRKYRGDLVNAQEPGMELEMVPMVDGGGGGGSRASDQELDGDTESEGAESGGSITEGTINVSKPLGELWLTLARVDGMCGRLLGRAALRGFDDVRAWLCCLVVMGPIVQADPIASSAPEHEGSLSVETAADLLQGLLKLHPDDLASDPFVSYACEMMTYLARRLKESPLALSFDLSRLDGNSSGSGGSGGKGKGKGEGEGGGKKGGGEGKKGGVGYLGSVRGRATVQEATALGNLGSTVEEGILFSMEEGEEGNGDGRDDLLTNTGDVPSLGKLIPLRCGHNNSYGNTERKMLLEHLALEGWVAPDRRPLEDVVSDEVARGFASE